MIRSEGIVTNDIATATAKAGQTRPLIGIQYGTILIAFATYLEEIMELHK